MGVNIHLIKDEKLDNCDLVLALPGVGLVGSVTGLLLTRIMDFEVIGFITSDEFAPLAPVHKGKVVPPVRLLYSKSKRLLLLLSEIVVPFSVANEFAHLLLSFVKEKGVGRVVLLGAIPLKGKERRVFVFGDVPLILKRAQGVELLKEGATTGVGGVLLALLSVNRVPHFAMLSEAFSSSTDVRAAFNLLTHLNRVLELNVDLSKVWNELKQSGELEREIEVMKADDSSSMYG